MQISLDKDRTDVHLVQLTDCHLGVSQGDKLLGMDTDDSLARVIDQLQQEQATPDLLLATGDLSNSGTPTSYRRFAQATDGLARHTLWLPGNHDKLEPMQAVFTGGDPLPRTAIVGGWQIIMLDSRIPGAVGGTMAAAELELLQQALTAHPDKHALVCLHHHPIDCGCDWLDGQRVDNADELFAVLDRFEQVRGVLWGHIHQQVDTRRKGVQLMATPSTCFQFAPDQRDFTLDRRNPGYRWLRLRADGDIETGVSRVEHQFDIDYDYTGGYE